MWKENICCVFAVKPTFSNSSGGEWSGLEFENLAVKDENNLILLMIFFNLNTCLWTMYRFCKEKLHVDIPTLLLVLFVNNANSDTI